MLTNQNILLIIAVLVVLYLLFGNNENFEEKKQNCDKTTGTDCPLANRNHRCGANCCRCNCNSEKC